MQNSYLVKGITKQTSSNTRFLSVLVYLFFSLVALFPIGKLNSFAPYIFIAILFIICIAINGCSLIKFKETNSQFFLVFSAYLFFYNIISSALFGFEIDYIFRTSAFVFFPIMSIEIGMIISKKNMRFSFSKLALFLLIFEFVICFIQSMRNQLGFFFTSLFGTSKYTDNYFILDYLGTKFRAIGSVGNPNLCGIFCCLLLSISLKDSKIVIKTLSAIVTGATILLTFSRTSIVIFLIVIFLSIVKLFNKDVSRFKKIGFSMATFSIAIILFIVFNDRFDLLFSSGGGMAPRFNIWTSLLNNSYNDDVVGLLEKFFGLGVTYVKTLEEVDNEYITMFMYSGFLGIILYSIAFICMIKELFYLKNQNARQTCFLLLIIWLISSVTATYYNYYLTSFFSLSFIFYTIYSNDNRASKTKL